MKMYHGFITKDGKPVVTVSDLSDGGPGEPQRLDMRVDVYSHSPDGPSWGYEGSGPAQLALGLCCNVTNDERRAANIYQAVKRVLVARLPQDENWQISGTALRALIDLCEANPNL